MYSAEHSPSSNLWPATWCCYTHSRSHLVMHNHVKVMHIVWSAWLTLWLRVEIECLDWSVVGNMDSSILSNSASASSAWLKAIWIPASRLILMMYQLLTHPISLRSPTTVCLPVLPRTATTSLGVDGSVRQLLYSGSRLSTFNSYLMIMKYSLRYGLTKQALSDLWTWLKRIFFGIPIQAHDVLPRAV